MDAESSTRCGSCCGSRAAHQRSRTRSATGGLCSLQRRGEPAERLQQQATEPPRRPESPHRRQQDLVVTGALRDAEAQRGDRGAAQSPTRWGRRTSHHAREDPEHAERSRHLDAQLRLTGPHHRTQVKHNGTQPTRSHASAASLCSCPTSADPANHRGSARSRSRSPGDHASHGDVGFVRRDLRGQRSTAGPRAGSPRPGDPRLSTALPGRGARRAGVRVLVVSARARAGARRDPIPAGARAPQRSPTRPAELVPPQGTVPIPSGWRSLPSHAPNTDRAHARRTPAGSARAPGKASLTSQRSVPGGHAPDSSRRLPRRIHQSPGRPTTGSAREAIAEGRERTTQLSSREHRHSRDAGRPRAICMIW